jgi:hypothetical protein
MTLATFAGATKAAMADMATKVVITAGTETAPTALVAGWG